MATDKVRLSARVTGRVQGVGFRHYTYTTARQLGVSGWVRNEPDGSVRLEAEGDRPELEDLLEAVKSGPRSAEVAAVDVDWGEAEGTFAGFGVRH